ncbi:MAG: GNAT family N-acetyltransferase [Methyloligellaceae bacterium]
MPSEPHIEIVESTTSDQVAKIANLMRDFVAWCRWRYRDRPELVNTYFEPSEWNNELASLGDKYGSPDGAMLLALVDGEPAGCVAMHTIGTDVCEMKRLFVTPQHHGMGLGRRLSDALIKLARRRRFKTMRLDTGELQKEALSLYRSLGFRKINPYYECPPVMKSRLVFMELVL